MEFKRFLVKSLILFFMLSTLITVAVWLLGSVFDGDARFGYDAMLAPLGYAAACMLPSLVTWSRRELSPGQLMIRKAVALVLIEAVILFLAFRSNVIDTGSPKVVFSIAGSVFVIFVLTHLFLWLKDSADARRINRDLEKYQRRHE